MKSEIEHGSEFPTKRSRASRLLDLRDEHLQVVQRGLTISESYIALLPQIFFDVSKIEGATLFQGSLYRLQQIREVLELLAEFSDSSIHCLQAMDEAMQRLCELFEVHLVSPRVMDA